MKKIILVIFSFILINSVISVPVYSLEQTEVMVQVNNKESKRQIENFIKKYNKIINKHDLKKFEKMYSPSYLNSDNLNLKSYLSLTKDVWASYSDIKYKAIIKSIRINGDNATVELTEESNATSRKNSDITKDKGILKSKSDSIVYLKKFDKDWKIISDKINYELTTIYYGSAKNIDFLFSVPEQVIAGENYTVTLQVSVPKGVYALGSITSEEIIYPDKKSKEVFREIPEGDGLLERLMKANKNNYNEVATASVGLTEVIVDKKAKPEVKITGIAVLSQRVNVIAKQDGIKIKKDSQQVFNAKMPDKESTDLPKNTDKK